MLPNSLLVILTTVHLTNSFKVLTSILNVPHDLGRHKTNAMALFLMHTELFPSPPGSADHNSILLALAYLSVGKRSDKIPKNIKQWTPDSIDRLQDCF